MATNYPQPNTMTHQHTFGKPTAFNTTTSNVTPVLGGEKHKTINQPHQPPIPGATLPPTHGNTLPPAGITHPYNSTYPGHLPPPSTSRLITGNQGHPMTSPPSHIHSGYVTSDPSYKYYHNNSYSYPNYGHSSHYPSNTNTTYSHSMYPHSQVSGSPHPRES